MIVTKSYYYGLPEDQVAALEAVTQATVDELYEHATVLWDRVSQEKGKKHDFGDYDYTLRADTIKEDIECASITVKRLRLQDHSAGWWAVLQWGHPYDDRPDRVDFWFHSNQGRAPKPDWKKFRDDWSFGKCDLHIQAIRSNAGEPWYAPVHTLNFKVPLLFHLRQAVEEL